MAYPKRLSKKVKKKSSLWHIFYAKVSTKLLKGTIFGILRNISKKVWKSDSIFFCLPSQFQLM